jgi:predicted nucleic acid-binding protein
VQVLNEFANVARRKQDLAWNAITYFLDGVREVLDVRSLDVAIHRQAVILAERYRIAFYDSVIVSSALSAGCTTLFTEDMHDGMLIDDRLRIINPFRDLR